MPFFTQKVETSIDSKVVDGVASERSAKALARFGAFVRRRMQTSLRYRKRASRPGEAPSARRSPAFTRTKTNKKTGAATKQPASPLRELIAFAVVDGGRAVIIGPMIFRSSAVGGGLVPRTLEQGGTSPILSHGKRKQGRYAPRPFVKPAFDAEVPRAAKLFGKGRR